MTSDLLKMAYLRHLPADFDKDFLNWGGRPELYSIMKFFDLFPGFWVFIKNSDFLKEIEVKKNILKFQKNMPN